MWGEVDEEIKTGQKVESVERGKKKAKKSKCKSFERVKEKVDTVHLSIDRNWT